MRPPRSTPPLALLGWLLVLLALPACDSNDDGGASDAQLYRGDGGTEGIVFTYRGGDGASLVGFGTFVDEFPVALTHTILDRQDTLTVVRYDAAGQMRYLYRILKRSGQHLPFLLEFDPAGSFTTMSVYDYDWAVGAGRRVASARVDAAGTVRSVAQAATVDAAPVRLDPARPPARAAAAGPQDDVFDEIRSLVDDLVQNVMLTNPVLSGRFGSALVAAAVVAAAATLPAGVILALAGSGLAVLLLGAGGVGPMIKQFIDSLDETDDGDLLDQDDAPDDLADADVSLDEMPLIGGEVVVGDDGSLADDAYAIYLDGKHYGDTQIGAYNTVDLGALTPGTKTLEVVCTVAPDNVGTLAVELGGGITFNDGSTSRSTRLTQGGRATYTVVVPRPLAKAGRPAALAPFRMGRQPG